MYLRVRPTPFIMSTFLKHFLVTFIFLTTMTYAQSFITQVSEVRLEPKPCTDMFIKHPLPHNTHAHGDAVTFYDSNGSGVAAGDLDNDGDIDIVLANLKNENIILWNEGNLSFRKESLAHGDSRAVNLVDVDGDGWLDIVFTKTLGSLSHWKNVQGDFQQEALKGVTRKAYTMAWGDLDRDGDLDLVTASYDSLLEKELRDTFLFSSGAGVSVFENTPTGFVETRLAEKAQALALTLFDIDEDGALDILVGNDFEVPDYAFLNRVGSKGAAEWLETTPFTTTTRNTMSFDVGDIDNDGTPELFATDMKPDFGDKKALAAWMPLMEKSYHRKVSSDPQKEENFLYRREGESFGNLAYDLNLDATGWSWSGKFGDLDNDGLLDLYVVNGMMAKDVFAHMPNFELVEENRAFRQTGKGFALASEWGLGATESGRGMTMADLDNDGDLDIVVNNLEAPSVLFENQLCGGAGLEIDLTWLESKNTQALGAVLKLQTSAGTLMREVRSGSGYLSGDPARVHFGVPEGATVLGLDILWSDGAGSSLTDLSASTLIKVTRESGE